ncbi:MAG: family intrarane metalloprotease protein [Microbacteriaceae bacterium]|nr:family intrarane metalloprotease protein [Microbacteriaceae bacterium]
MLSPDWPYTRVVLIVALVVLVVALVVRAVTKDRTEYQRFKRFERTRNRQRMMRRWLITSFAFFGVAAALLLVLAWRYVGIFLSAVRATPPGRWLGALVAGNGFIPGLALGVAIALVIGTVVAIYLARKSADVPTLGDIGALLPRNRAELYYGFGLSVNAGLVEELLFRLAVPAALFGASGNVLAAVLGSVVLFGALHAYQGLPGVIGATLIGAFLMLLYLCTGSILVSIIAHALIDLRSLVVIPVLVYGVQRVR